MVAAFLGGLVGFGMTGGACAWALQPGPAWTPSGGANPALVAFQQPLSGGQAGLTVDLLTPNPLDLTYRVFYARSDTGSGAASLVLGDARTYWTDSTDEIKTYEYTWGRRWSERWAVGAGVRWEQRRTALAVGWALPEEHALGCDLGALYQPEERIWAGFAVHDAFGTTLRSQVGTSTVLPASYHLTLGRQLTPRLKVILDGTSGGTTAGTTAGPGLGVRAELAGDRFTYRAGLAAGRDLAWSAGVATGVGAYVLEAAVQGTGTRMGGAVGVTARW
jgi:hypothetical protein